MNGLNGIVLRGKDAVILENKIDFNFLIVKLSSILASMKLKCLRLYLLNHRELCVLKILIKQILSLSLFFRRI